MADEIAEFLKRAAQRRAEQLRQQAEQARRQAEQKAAPPPPPPPPDRRPTAMPSQGLPSQSTRPSQTNMPSQGPRRVVEAEVVGPATYGPPQQPFATQPYGPAQTYAPAPADPRVSQLTSNRVAQSDEQMAFHLHKQFDHQLGRISDPAASVTATTTAETPTTTESPAPMESFAKLVKETNPVRLAILMQEVLRRPTERWES